MVHLGDKKSSYGVMGKPGRRKDPLDDVGVSGIIILNENRLVHKIFLLLEESLVFQKLCSLELDSLIVSKLDQRDSGTFDCLQHYCCRLPSCRGAAENADAL